jgi:hypothetical protein
MNPRDVRKPAIIVLLVVALAIGLALARLGATRGPAVSVSPAAITTDRMAAFYVTNSERHAVLLMRLDVQVPDKDNWKTLSQEQSIHTGGTGRDNYWSGPLEPGQYRQIWLYGPEKGPWRACVVYSPELRGVEGLMTRIRFGLLTGSLPNFRRRGYYGMQQVVSREITR